MRGIFKRSLLFVLLISGLAYTDNTAAQGFESLVAAIEELKTEDLNGFDPESRIADQDSTKIVSYLSQTSDFSEPGSDTSLINFRKAFELSLRTRSLKFLSLTIQELGTCFVRNGNLRESMSCYLKSLEIEQIRQDKSRIAELNVSLGYVYRGMNVFNKSLEYFQKGLEIYGEVNDTLGLANTYYNIGGLYSVRHYCETRNEAETLNDCETALDFDRKSYELYLLLHDTTRLADISHGYAYLYNKMGRYEEALEPIQKTLQFYRQINDPSRLANALNFLGILYRSLKQYDKSILAIKEAEEIMKANNLTIGIQYLYEEMANTYYKGGDYKQAYEYFIKFMTIEAQAINEENSKEIFELETKYQTKVKENEILKLKAEKRKRSTLVFTLSGAMILLLITGISYIRLIKKNKIIADQKVQISEVKIQELEKEKSYLAARSVMEGEEAERSRLASDLHNGLGGLLSGIKINLSSMKENAVITHENVSAFNHAISLLDTSISELRRIAHNLMPETLNHYGLKTALEDFLSQISPAGLPEIGLQCFGEEIRYSKEIELTMYRIIQELVNNSLKHAEATLITIQVFSEPKRLYAQVTDNGKGFEIKMNVVEKKGKGIENIRERVTALNGRFELWSQPGQGTEISVELDIT